MTTETENKPTNVISFPKKQPSNLAEAKTPEEFSNVLSENKNLFIDTILSKNMNQLYNRLGMDGFNIEDEKFFTDFWFVVEALKSAMLRQCGMPHALQEFVDTNFKPPPIEEFEENADDDE